MKRLAAGAALFVLAGILLIASLTATFTGPRISPTCVAALPAKDLGRLDGLDREQAHHAALIVATAAEAGLPARAAVIAVATSLRESRLRNLTHGRRDTFGLFRQRPSPEWGTPGQILDPRHATRSFYQHLTAVPRWERIPLTRAANAVQRAANPDAYNRWERPAQRIVDALTGACAAIIPGERASSVIAYAQAQLGKPYRWGAEGPASFDCSGLVMRAYQAAGIPIPRVTYQQWAYGIRIPAGREQPGDLVFFRMENDGPGHVGLVIGNGQMIHAPQTGDIVKIAPYNRPDVVGFTRPGGVLDSTTTERDKANPATLFDGAS